MEDLGEKQKALLQSKSQITEHGETGYSNHEKHLVFVNLKSDGKYICPKIRALSAVVDSRYFLHLNKEQKKKAILLINCSYFHFVFSLQRYHYSDLVMLRKRTINRFYHEIHITLNLGQFCTDHWFDR